jgi:shikimate dehydrogenase
MRQITADTKLFGLLGHGASYSLSPAMHNHAAQLFNKDLVYLYFDIKPGDVEQFLKTFWDMGGFGLNVTMPHKIHVSKLVDASELESVNTLVRRPDGWLGHSTDGVGFLEGLKRSNNTISDFDCVIMLGSGGAAQAVLNAIAVATLNQPPVVVIHRRSKKNDRALLNAFTVSESQILTFRDFTIDSALDTMRQTAGQRRLIIQATSAPKHGSSLAEFKPILDEMDSHDLLVDLIYDQPSSLYHFAIAKNIRCLDGLPMLIEQARMSQFHWWGKSASYDDMLLAIKNSGWRGTLAPPTAGL